MFWDNLLVPSVMGPLVCPQMSIRMFLNQFKNIKEKYYKANTAMLVSKYHYSLCHKLEGSSSILKWKPEIMHMGFISQLSV